MENVTQMPLDHQTEEPTKRATKIFGRAIVNFVQDEQRRLGEEAPDWLVLASAARGIGSTLGLWAGLNSPAFGEAPRGRHEVVESLIALIKEEMETALRFCDEHQKGQQV
ncbi:MAG TPA: hypothetical protein VKE26_19165 [Xanthobacteraceae bacterium]|nr:hypothetical protein [Xanthobacteraceae bacterium]